MTTMRINGSDRDTVRLFSLDLPKEAVERFVTEAGTGEWPLRAALGAQKLRANFVETVRISDLDAMTLSQYLIEAHGVEASQLADMRPRIDALQGYVLILPAQAFANTSQEITVAGPLRWIGTFGEIAPTAAGPRLTSASARGEGGRKPISDAAMSGRIATLALLVLFALVAVMIWVAS